jgi:transposase
MIGDISRAEHIYVVCGHTDMRKSIGGLTVCVQQSFHLNPFSSTLFLFCGRRRDRIKVLFWEGDGFVLLYKRLEKGSFQWPKSEGDVRNITQQQLRWLMEGLSIDQPKAHKKVNEIQII